MFAHSKIHINLMNIVPLDEDEPLLQYYFLPTILFWAKGHSQFNKDLGIK